MCASYDEELTPDTDPPLIEPPPPATLLGRIFAHRRPPRTVVEAPLQIVAGPVPPPAPPADPPPDAEARKPGTPPAVVPEPAGEPAQAEPPQPEPAQARRELPPEPPAAERVATRYCPACRERVPLAADGRHCVHGHRLSPAHARRRLFFWRR